MNDKDIITNPPHYTQGIETIKIIRAKLTDKEYVGYLKGTIMKYNTRIGLKGSEQDASDDAGKLSWYAIKHKPAEIEKANEDIADEILNGKYCVGGTCED